MRMKTLDLTLIREFTQMNTRTQLLLHTKLWLTCNNLIKIPVDLNRLAFAEEAAAEALLNVDEEKPY